MRKFTSTWLSFVFLTLVVGKGTKLSLAFETNLTIDLSSGAVINHSVVNATVLLPFDSVYMASVLRTGPAIILAFEEVRQRKLLSNHKVKLDFRDSNCSNGMAPYQAMSAFSSNVNVFFGPSCDFALAPVARLLKYLNTPLLTAGALTTDFTDPKTTNETEFFLTTRTGFAFKEMVEFLLMYFQRHDWKKVMLMYEVDGLSEVTGPQTCRLFMSTLVQHLKSGWDFGNFDIGANNVNATLQENMAKSLGHGMYAGKKRSLVILVIASITRTSANAYSKI